MNYIKNIRYKIQLLLEEIRNYCEPLTKGLSYIVENKLEEIILESILPEEIEEILNSKDPELYRDLSKMYLDIEYLKDILINYYSSGDTAFIFADLESFEYFINVLTKLKYSYYDNPSSASATSLILYNAKAQYTHNENKFVVIKHIKGNNSIYIYNYNRHEVLENRYNNIYVFSAPV